MDLDDLWSYMKTHADPGWEALPTFLDAAVPRALEMLRARKMRITFFVTGTDASLERNREMLEEIVREKHELGNHSLSHDLWFDKYSDSQVEDEIAAAEQYIERICGRKPAGFRAPGYSLTRRVVKTLEKRGYLYDSSTLPTSIALLARTYYFSTGKFSRKDREQRSTFCGSIFECMRPISPYRWSVGNGLLELPITTFPLFRTPIHPSYLYALFIVSKKMALRYLSTALCLLKALRIQPVIILHPPDFLGADDTCDLMYFPAMNRLWKEKKDFMEHILDLLQSSFECVPLHTIAEEIGSRETALLSTRSLPL